MKIKFHDGLVKSISLEKMALFENESVYNRLFKEEEITLASVMEEIGLCALDFSNVHEGSEFLTDIDARSSRLFTIWGEDIDTGKVVGLIRGFILLLPFSSSSPPDWEEFYKAETDLPTYPMAIISSFRVVKLTKPAIDDFISKILENISITWKKLRSKTIMRLPNRSMLWKRYVLSIKEIIHFSFTCPSIDREIIEALRRKGFNITGFLQLLSSSAPIYDDVAIENHILSAKKIFDQHNKN